MRLPLRQQILALAVGLAAGFGFFGFMVANYFAQRSRLCPAGLPDCDPSALSELGELWFEVQSFVPFVAAIVAGIVGLLATLIFWFASFVREKASS